jgi:hypothetical protein
MPRPREVIIAIANLLCWLISPPGPAQDSDSKSGGNVPTIRGTVREAGNMAPISDVEVSLSSLETGKTETGGSVRYGRPIAKTKTDITGAFSFQPDKAGLYTVSASKDGYFPVAQDSIFGVPMPNQVDLKAGAQPAEITLVLGRTGFLEGVVVDAETKRPVPNLGIQLNIIGPAWGVRRLMPQATVRTDADGRFRIGGRPYSYILGIRPQVWDKPRLLATFSEEDRKAAAEDYEAAYWPGTTDSDAAQPIAIPSGGDFNLGVVSLRKVQYHSVHVSLAEGSCMAGEKVQFRIPNNRFGKAGQDLGSVPCGKDFLLTGFPPGSYRLEVTPALGTRRHEEMTWGETEFDIADQNVDITVTMQRGVDVEGNIVVPDGAAKPAFEKIGIHLQPVVGDLTPGESQFLADAQGRLHITNVRATEQWAEVTGVPEGYCVRQIRYNGTPVRGWLVPFQNGGVSRTLEIVLDDKPAVVSGTVMKGDRPVGNAQVLLTPWPVDSPNAVWPPRQATADGDGKFRFFGLASGDYLLVALPPELREKWREPGILQLLLRQAKKVTLAERSFETVTLAVSSLR